VKRRRRILLWAAVAALMAVYFVRITMDKRIAGPGVPLMQQRDYTEAVCTIDGQKKSVATSGCGAACIAMAAAALADSGETPGTLFQWAYDNGLYYGDGLGHEAMSRLAAHAGLRGEWLDNQPELILAALRSGHLVAAHMGPGTFTKDGHYILLWGVDGDGLIRVNDPGSAERSGRTFPLELILDEVKTSRAFLSLSPGGLRAVPAF